MTIAVTEPKKITALGDGAATVFSFSPMIIFATTDLVVTKVDATGIETVLVKGTGSTNYSVSVSTFPGTGSITYPATGGTPLASGESVIMKAQLPLEQPTNLENQGGYFADTQETQFDKIVKQNIQQQEEIDRTMQLPIGVSATVSAELPIPVADRLLGWNSANNALTNVVSAGTLATTAFTESLLDDTTAGEFRNTLHADLTQGDLLVQGAGVSERLAAPSNDGALLYRNNASSGDLKWSATGPSANQIPESNATDWSFIYPPDNALAHTGVPVNLGINVALSTNDVVFTLTSADGATPSATNPVWIPMRSSTASSGVTTWEKMTATETLTLPAGGTLGHTAADISAGDTTIRCYLYAMRNGANDVELAVARQALWSGDTVQSTTLIDATADSDSVLYSTTARTSKPVALIGVIEMSATTTAGTWTSVDNVSVWNPGMKKTGDIIQSIYKTADGDITTTSTIPTDAVPQSSGGGPIAGLDTTITPTSALNRIEIDANSQMLHDSASSWLTIALFQDAETSARISTIEHEGTVAAIRFVSLRYSTLANSTSARTYKIRGGGGSAGTTRIMKTRLSNNDKAQITVREIYT